jgi:hypothetical protein
VTAAFVIQNAKRMRRIISSSAAVWLYSPPPPHAISHTVRFQGKNITEHKICAFIFSEMLSEIFLILRRIQRDIIVNVYESVCKVPVILLKF